jgi:hypothetical protein
MEYFKFTVIFIVVAENTELIRVMKEQLPTAKSPE